MSQVDGFSEAGLRTPKAAAIAGVVFSLLTLASFGFFWSAIPTDPQASGASLAANANEVALALNLIPFAGIAFLWFIGVIRDRLGRREDRFFATVFFGSGLLFLGTLFVAAAVVGAMLIALGREPAAFSASSTFRFASAVSYNLVNIYMVKMAGVFMISTSTVAMSTRIAPRWLAALGYLLAALLLLGSAFFRWSFALFPLWVLLLSIYILVGNLGRRAEA
jgi:MFS family permease